ncbi:MAG: hypothetical protein GY726_12310, partial [Proteobacteria bacterium]|nr:hypothetical protein [Pseudomonadota bacterium]
MNDELCSAWAPGLDSDIPPAYQKLETICCPENVTSTISDVKEISTLTGLSHEELVSFRPERLVVHELLIRITANIVVNEGKDERDLGRDFRVIANTILSEYIQPHMEEIRRVHADLHNRVYQLVQNQLGEALFETRKPVMEKRSLFWFLRRKEPQDNPGKAETIQEREHRAIHACKEKGLVATDELEIAVFKSLYRVLGLISGTRGYIGSDRSFLTDLVSAHVCNQYGSRMIGLQISPWIEAAIEQKKYTRAVCADAPILISLKGASAAGKSSLRPMLRQTLKAQGINSGDYATISPDIWRRFLLDYDSLGAAYKYAGRLTGKEVIIIDGKLDRYIREKSNRDRAIPHLLVDRFRFDSFSSEKIWKVLHGTYVQYVDTMYMYFIVTPPEAIVERGWERGLKTGRYKSVEDFLDHAVEAYAGMPKIFFKWLAYDQPLFKYEFLNNDVPRGTFPTTIAFGTQQEINIISVSEFIDIERYRKINIEAKSPGQIYPEKIVLSVDNNMEFLGQIVKKIPNVNFIDRATNTAYLQARNGVFRVMNERIFAEKLEDKETNQIFC